MLKDLGMISLDRNNKVRYGFDPNNPLITGQRRLIQQIVKRIFTIRGSNAFRPNEGSTFLHLMQAINDSEINNVKASLPLVLSSVKDQIIRNQNDIISSGVQLSEQETLVDLVLEDVTFDPVFGGWLIDIKVITPANETTISL